MNNEKKSLTRKNGRFNFIDAVIIFIVLAAVAIFVYLLMNNKIFQKVEQTEILYTVRVPLIKNELLTDIKKLEKGQLVLNSSRGTEMGVIEKVEITTPAPVNIENKKMGIVFEAEYPDHSRVIITVRAKSEKEKGGYFIDGFKLLVGVEVHFRTPYFTSYGNCTSITNLVTGETITESDTSKTPAE